MLQDELYLTVVVNKALLFGLKIVRIFDKLVFRTKVASILEEIVDWIDTFL